MKEIKEFSGYTLTRDGDVISSVTKKPKSTIVGNHGYRAVDLYKEGKRIRVLIHRLLALHYLPNPENKRTVNHIDGNKLNNSLENLEWATDSENIQHGYDNGLYPDKKVVPMETYKDILVNRFLKGESMTQISTTIKTQLTQTSKHLRAAAKALNLEEEFNQEIRRAKIERNKRTAVSQRVHKNIKMFDSKTDVLLQEFTSLAEAQYFLGKKSSGPICNALSGRAKTAYGYKWL